MIDDDIDAPEDFDKPEMPEKPSLREVWENNPVLKLAAIFVGFAVLLGGYFVFFAPEDDNNKTIVRIKDAATAKQTLGKEVSDPAYEKALEDVNKKTAEDAARKGGSAIPLPIAIGKGSGLDIPAMPDKPKSDVLAEWRKVADEGRMKAAKQAIEEENSAPAPEVVPMAQPIRPQPQVQAKQDPNDIKRLADQMRVIVGAQAPPLPRKLDVTAEPSPYSVMKEKEKDARMAQDNVDGDANVPMPGGTGAGAAAVADSARTKTIVAAGSIAYAQLMNELNSDITGPVLVHILSGPFAGGRAIGKIMVKEEYMVIEFNRIVKDAVSYKIEAVALDEKTTLAGQATDVDHHYFTRIILPAAADFLTGYASSVAQTEQTVSSTQGVGTTTANPKPNSRESLFKGLETAADGIGEMLEEGADRPITVKIAKGTTMGVLFTDTVTTKDAEK